MKYIKKKEGETIRNVVKINPEVDIILFKQFFCEN